MQQPPYDQSGFYNQPTSQHWTGQQPPGQRPPPQPPKKSRRRLWVILGIIGGAVLLCCIVTSVAAALTPSTPTAQTTPTSAPTQAGAIVAVSVTTTPTATASATPTPKPKPTATATPRPVVHVTPTQRPQPTATHCVGVNNNPWCYDFNYGKTITYPPSTFCNYFNCIATFYAPDDPGDGYIVQCVDGTYSQSGGESGACSSHGGVGRTLYAH